MAELYAFFTDEYVAKMGGVQRELRSRANGGAARARAILAEHRHTGDSRIVVEHGVIDYYVVLDDSRGARAAAAIEYGRSGGARGGATQGVHALGGAFR